MNLQEVFDKVATHLLTQNARSTRLLHNGSVCVYRGADGTKCAIGCLIPDELYRPEMEDLGQILNNPLAKTALEESGIVLWRSKKLAFMLLNLQRIHDKYEPSSWRERLKDLAHDLGLTFAPGVSEDLPEETQMTDKIQITKIVLASSSDDSFDYLDVAVFIREAAEGWLVEATRLEDEDEVLFSQSWTSEALAKEAALAYAAQNNEAGTEKDAEALKRRLAWENAEAFF